MAQTPKPDLMLPWKRGRVDVDEPAWFARAKELRYCLHKSTTVRLAWEARCVRLGEIPVCCWPYGRAGRWYGFTIPLFKVGRRILEWKTDWPPAWVRHNGGTFGAGWSPTHLSAAGLSTGRIGELQILIDYLEEFTE